MSNFVIFLLAASIFLTEARWWKDEDGNSGDNNGNGHGHGNGNDNGSGSGDVAATTEAPSGNSYSERMQEVAATLNVLTNDSVSATDKIAYLTQLVMEQVDPTDIETQAEVVEKIKDIVEFFTQIQLMIASASQEVQDTYKEIVALASDPSFYSQTAQSQIDQVEAYFNKMTDAGKAELNKLDQEAKAIAEKLGVQTRKFILGNIHGAMPNFGHGI
ncbi:hypothetical protein WR25_09991 [Diploscapter pachys]|uniref:SXP/RAL-2 family protein Ani s 5-like cation-binding domain-containing protein n=1 Tax=Diploscapter pachys TaxID=2018661 RepID=A0A2A2KFE0_9BILA|nr:hypothetical protein WR25_09991 [Diploscapter pachys]